MFKIKTLAFVTPPLSCIMQGTSIMLNYELRQEYMQLIWWWFDAFPHAWYPYTFDWYRLRTQHPLYPICVETIEQTDLGAASRCMCLFWRHPCSASEVLCLFLNVIDYCAVRPTRKPISWELMVAPGTLLYPLTSSSEVQAIMENKDKTGFIIPSNAIYQYTSFFLYNRNRMYFGTIRHINEHLLHLSARTFFFFLFHDSQRNLSRWWILAQREPTRHRMDVQQCQPLLQEYQYPYLGNR